MVAKSSIEAGNDSNLGDSCRGNDCSQKLHEEAGWNKPTINLALVTEGGSPSTPTTPVESTTTPPKTEGGSSPVPTLPVESTPTPKVTTTPVESTSTPPKTEGGSSPVPTVTPHKTVEYTNPFRALRPVTPPVLPPFDFDIFPTKSPPKKEFPSPFLPGEVSPPIQTETKSPPPEYPIPIPFKGIITGKGDDPGGKEIYTKAHGNEDSLSILQEQINGAKIESARVGKGKQEGQLLPPEDPLAIGSYKVPGTEWLLAHEIIHRRRGPFYSIDKMQDGDQVTLHQNGKNVAYTVVDKTSFSRDDRQAWNKVLTPAQAGSPDTLKLVTCGGVTDAEGWHTGRTAVTLVRSDRFSSTKQPDTGSTEVTFNGTEPQILGRSLAPVNVAAPTENTSQATQKHERTLDLSAESNGSLSATLGLPNTHVDVGIKARPGGGTALDLGAPLTVNADRNDVFKITPQVTENMGGRLTSTESQSILNPGTSVDLDGRFIHLLSPSTAIEIRGGVATNPTQAFGQALVVQKVSEKIVVGAGFGDYTAANMTSAFGPLAEVSFKLDKDKELYGGVSDAGGNMVGEVGIKFGL